MAALVTSQLATSGTVLGITDRFRRAGFQGVRPRSPADAPLGMRTTGASAAPKQAGKRTAGPGGASPWWCAPRAAPA
uniref:Truncated Waxy protein n=1 Tax=Triticum compactum TaxID=69993 RepID=A0A0K0PX69_9POAL|nr:truncated Waxy protein [Triticum compactum]